MKRLRVLVRRLSPSVLHQRDRALDLFRLWSQALEQRPTARALLGHRRRLLELLVSFIEEAKQGGQIGRDVDPTVLANILVVLGDGMCVSRVLILSDGVDAPDATLDTLLEHFAQNRE